jgi:hypothetical protein
MQERLRRLSIPLARWSIGGPSSTPSVSTPKTTESLAASYDTRSLGDTTSIGSPSSRHSLPVMLTQTDGVERRIMTEPLRPPAPAVMARGRSTLQPNGFDPRLSGLGTPLPPAAEVRRDITTSTSSPRGAVRDVLGSLGFARRPPRKHQSGKIKHLGIILVLILFCMTAVVCILPPQE